MRSRASSHAARKRAQAVAFGTIRALSFLTIAILGLILCFIVYRGLRYDNVVRSTTLPRAESEPEGLVVAVNDATDLAQIDFPVLFGMFTDEYINWSKIDGEKVDLLPLAPDPAGPAGRKVERFLFGEAPQWGSLFVAAPDAAAAVERVAATPGAVAIVPAEAVRGAKGIRVLPLRRIVLAANPEVAVLVDNRSIEDLGQPALERLMSGKVANWKELGGPDLPVRLLAPPASGPLADALRGAALPAAAGERAKDQASYESALGSTPGAVGYLLAGDAAAAGLPPLVLTRRESGWNLTWDYLVREPALSGRVGGISTIIANTFLMLVLTGLMAAPIGVAAAVYLVEYAKQGPLVRLLRLGTETLAGIPSIIFGLFGFLFFVNILRLGFGLLSGCLTLTIMILPTIVRTSEEALKAVPAGLREGSLALGATKLQTIVRVAVPAASSGILTGLILGIGRAVGETAALLFTMGSDYKLAKGLFSSARVLSSHIYLLFAEGISFDRAFSTAAVLILVVVAFNFAARRLVGGMSRRRGGG